VTNQLKLNLDNRRFPVPCRMPLPCYPPPPLLLLLLLLLHIRNTDAIRRNCLFTDPPPPPPHSHTQTHTHTTHTSTTSTTTITTTTTPHSAPRPHQIHRSRCGKTTAANELHFGDGVLAFSFSPPGQSAPMNLSLLHALAKAANRINKTSGDSCWRYTCTTSSEPTAPTFDSYFNVKWIARVER
jgi:hypothetical protein